MNGRDFVSVTEYLYAVFEPVIDFVAGLNFFSIGINIVVFLIIFGSFALMLRR